MRAVRAKVDAAALGTSAYYMHPTMEAHLSSFNTSTYVPYVASGPNGPTFEGFPIKWVGVMRSMIHHAPEPVSDRLR